MGQVLLIFVVNFFIMLREFHVNTKTKFYKVLRWIAKRNAKIKALRKEAT